MRKLTTPNAGNVVKQQELTLFPADGNAKWHRASEDSLVVSYKAQQAPTI